MSESKKRRRGRDHLGSIASDLQNLRGIPTVINELIQNADEKAASSCIPVRGCRNRPNSISARPAHIHSWSCPTTKPVDPSELCHADRDLSVMRWRGCHPRHRGRRRRQPAACAASPAGTVLSEPPASHVHGAAPAMSSRARERAGPSTTTSRTPGTTPALPHGPTTIANTSDAAAGKISGANQDSAAHPDASRPPREAWSCNERVSIVVAPIRLVATTPMKWTDLPDMTTAVGGTVLVSSGGHGPGALVLQQPTSPNPVPVRVRSTCEGEGTVAVAATGLAGSGSCFAYGRAEFQLNLPPTMVPPGLTVYVNPGVIWRVAVSS
jgi:hypothetical protein